VLGSVVGANGPGAEDKRTEMATTTQRSSVFIVEILPELGTLGHPGRLRNS
jgi:hypothetical protein